MTSASDGSMNDNMGVTSRRLPDVVLGMKRRRRKSRLLIGGVENANDQSAERRDGRGAQGSQQLSRGEPGAEQRAGQPSRHSGTNGRYGDSQGDHDGLL